MNTAVTIRYCDFYHSSQYYRLVKLLFIDNIEILKKTSLVIGMNLPNMYRLLRHSINVFILLLTFRGVENNESAEKFYKRKLESGN